MAYKRIIEGEDLKIVDQPACIHFRSKAMYVTGDLDPTHVDAIGNHEVNCWCNVAQHKVGPDGKLVDRAHCIPGRDCYRPSY